jgi:hypothetical protein
MANYAESADLHLACRVPARTTADTFLTFT